MLLEILTSLLYSVYSVIRLIYWYGEAIFRNFVVPPPMKSLDGETILVTGGAAGIGKAICNYISRSTKNVKLVIWDVNGKGLDQLAQELQRNNNNSGGIRVFVYQVDISKKENIQRAAALVKQDVGGPVTVLINNAGIGPINSFMDYEDSEIEQTLQINLMAHLWTLRAFLGDMMKVNHGRIMNIASVAALTPNRCALPYVTSKFGVAGYGEALKAELEYFGYDGIHVTTVFPNVTKTAIIKSGFLDEKEMPAGLPENMKKMWKPEEVAEGAVDGMRRELEFVYFPKMAGAFPGINCLIPMKQRKAMGGYLGKVLKFTDPEDSRRFGGDRKTQKTKK